MNLLDAKTLNVLKKYANEKGKSKIQSPNMAVSGMTGKGDYPVKSAVVKSAVVKPDPSKGFKVTKEYKEARRKRGNDYGEEDKGKQYDMFGNLLI
jgi:hypothetical protein